MHAALWPDEYWCDYASDSMFYPLTMCVLQIVFMIMIMIVIMNIDEAVVTRYGMRYMAKTMHAALRAHYPNTPEKDILKVSFIFIWL